MPGRNASALDGSSDMKAPDEVSPTTVLDVDWSKGGNRGRRDGLTPSFLYVEKGPGAGQLLPIPAGKLVIGRATVSDLRLEHPSVSRRHAQLTRISNRFYVRDLGSQNGTYVNRVRIATEVEVHPGDELQVGAAMMRLRGPVAPAEAPTVAEMPQVGGDAPQSSGALDEPEALRKSGLMRIAVLAGAVGFGLAAVLVFALVNLPTSPSVRTLDEEEAETATVTPSPSAAPQAKGTQAQDPAGAGTAAGREREQAAGPQAPPKGEVAEVDKAIRRAMKESGQPAAAPLPKTRAAILAKYESGSLAQALELARESEEGELVAKLMKFQSLQELALAAVKAKDGSAAIKNYEAALKLDEQLSSGWSKYGDEIRRELSNLWTVAGGQHLQNEDPDAARKAFRAALHYEPRNSRAKAQLAKLDAAKRAAADQAFEEDDAETQESAPPRKKPQGRAAEIDAAFDD